MSNKNNQIKITKLDSNAIIPKFSREGDAGRDLYTLRETIIPAKSTIVIPTGLAISLPQDKEAQIRPRSGISLKGLQCKTTTDFDIVPDLRGIDFVAELRVQLGTIDSNYRGDIGIIVKNESYLDVIIPKHTRLAQMIISNVVTDDLVEVDSIETTERNDKGFGSSGVN